jgi:hypothetical protein
MFIIDGIIWIADRINPGIIGPAVLWFLAAFIAWRLSLWIFPERKCPRCKGTGAWGFGGMLRTCGRCNGVGRERRIGAP